MTASTDTRDAVTVLLAAVVAHARETQDPRWLRMSLLADDLLERSAAVEHDAVSIAQVMIGYVPAAPSPAVVRQRTIALDVLEAAQTSMDSDEPDPRAAAAGLAAARRLIAVRERTGDPQAQYALTRALLGANGGYAPAHLCDGGPEPEVDS
jgi:hypothetical protein